MATQQEELRKNKIAETKRELQRRSLDELKVYNPLKEPFSTTYDGFVHTAKAESEAVFLRYIAEKWMREFVNHMINMDMGSLVMEENERRRKAGLMELTKHDGNNSEFTFLSEKNMSTANENLRMEYMKQIYRGVSKEHGMDMPESTPTRKDRRPTDARILEQLDAEMGTELPKADESVEVEEKKEKLAEELDE